MATGCRAAPPASAPGRLRHSRSRSRRAPPARPDSDPGLRCRRRAGPGPARRVGPRRRPDCTGRRPTRPRLRAPLRPRCADRAGPALARLRRPRRRERRPGQRRWWPGQRRWWPRQRRWWPGQRRWWPGQRRWWPRQRRWWPGQRRWRRWRFAADRRPGARRLGAVRCGPRRPCPRIAPSPPRVGVTLGGEPPSGLRPAGPSGMFFPGRSSFARRVAAKETAGRQERPR